MRVVIGEDLFLLRDGLVRLLAAHGFEIAAAVGSAPELLRALTELAPDVGIVDVRMPPGCTDDGLRVALAARRARPGLPVLVLSQYVEQLYARELLADQAGGVGYLLKDRVFSDDAFAGAVRDVAAGGTVIDPEVVSRLLARRTRSGPLAALTPREREVLALMAEGRSNAAIAARLFVTEKAVSKHAAGIFAKLDLAPTGDDNRRVLAVLAYLNGLPVVGDRVVILAAGARTQPAFRPGMPGSPNRSFQAGELAVVCCFGWGTRLPRQGLGLARGWAWRCARISGGRRGPGGGGPRALARCAR